MAEFVVLCTYKYTCLTVYFAATWKNDGRERLKFNSGIENSITEFMIFLRPECKGKGT